MATVYDMGGDTLVVADIVTGVTSPGQAQIGAANAVGMDIGSVIFGQQTANNTSFTVTAMTTLAPVFNISTSGAATLSANQTYVFEAMYTVQVATNASHAYSCAFGGGATISSIGYQMYSTPNVATGTATVAANAVYVSTAGASPLTAANTASGEQTLIYLNGMLTVGSGGGGTIIPQIKLNVGTVPTTSVTVYKGSYIGFWPVGNATTQTVGSWS